MLTFESGNPLAHALIHIVDGATHYRTYNTEALTNAQIAEEYATWSEDKTQRTITVRCIIEAQMGQAEQFSINLTATTLEWNSGQGGPSSQFSVFGLQDDSPGWQASFNALNVPGYSTLQQAAEDYATSYACEILTPHEVKVRRVEPNGMWGQFETFWIVPPSP